MLLRAVAGFVAATLGAVYLAGGAELGTGAWIAVSLVIAGGLSLALGFLTPVAGVVVALGGVGVELSWLPAPPSGLSGGRLAAWLVAVIAAAIVLLGPGAYSLDARLFGRREIVIPAPHPRSS